jgi:hypothetical protein
MKKRLVRFALAAALCIGVVLVVLALMPRSQVTRANYDRITVGMTLAEVEELFGQKGGVFHGFANKRATTYYWQADDGALALIDFDDNERVAELAQWSDSTETIGDKLRRWTRWAWRK